MDVEICKIAVNSVIKLLMFLNIKWSLDDTKGNLNVKTGGGM